jgi:hypothetical protein
MLDGDALTLDAAAATGSTEAAAEEEVVVAEAAAAAAAAAASSSGLGAPPWASGVAEVGDGAGIIGSGGGLRGTLRCDRGGTAMRGPLLADRDDSLEGKCE